MTYCVMYQDWPLRVKVVEKGVVHAARPYGSRPNDKFYKFYKDTSIFISCMDSWRRSNQHNRLIHVEKNTPITCKNCLRELGDTDYKKEISERFVIMDKDGLFMKSRGKRTGELADARLFKAKAPAIVWITKILYLDGEDNEVNYGTWLQLGRDKMPRRVGKRLLKGYRIFETTMQLGKEIEIEVDSVSTRKTSKD